jgi:penicillin-binding protein 2
VSYKSTLGNQKRRSYGDGRKYQSAKLIGVVLISMLIVLGAARHVAQAGKPRIDFALGSSEGSLLRGLIYDRNGQRLAYNTNTYIVEIKHPTAEELAVLQTRYTQGYLLADNYYIPSGKEISTALSLQATLQAEIAELSSRIEVVNSLGRTYVFPTELAALIGFVGAPTAEDIEDGYGYRDLTGKQGVEAAYEDKLSGRDSADGRGEDIQLTIDAQWQKRLYELVAYNAELTGAQAGAAAVMKADTGEVMAYVSYPTFNAQEFADGITAAAYSKYTSDPKLPMLDKVATLQGPPGSAFKIITASYLLQSGNIDATTEVFSTGCIYLAGYPFCEFAQHYLGQLEVTEALAVSSNIFFCEHLSQAVGRNGVDPYVEFAHSLGIGKAPKVSWVQAAAGVMPSPEYKLQTNGETWYLGDTCNTAIGQGMVSVSPLQLLIATNAIATGGNLLTPRILTTEQTQLEGLGWNQDGIQLVHSGMRKVVVGDRGTDRWVLGLVPGNVWAKTGTAEAVYFENGEMKMGVHAWVTGFFDYNSERYSFVAHLNYGGGAWNATPIMRDFLTCLFEQTCQ